MSRLLAALAFAGFVLVVTGPGVLAQGKQKVEITKKWNGSVDDEKATQPDVFTSTKGLEAAWKEWKAEGDVPKVDFTKNLVVAAYTRGGRINMSGATLNDGDLTVLAIATRDLRPGFRYALGVVSKDGVKTVNKKALPQE